MTNRGRRTREKYPNIVPNDLNIYSPINCTNNDREK